MIEAIRLLALLSVAGLGLVWIVYPVGAGLVGWLRRRSANRGGFRPAVTIVIASREPEAAVRERIEDLLRTSYPLDLIEVVVARDADGPAYELPATLGGCRITLVPADSPGGKAAALNAAVRTAGGDCLVFADTYQRYEADTVTRLVEALEPPDVAGATGSYELATGARGIVAAYWRFEKWLRRAESRIHSPVGATGAVYAIRRDAWQPLPPGLILDDVWVPMQIVLAGRRIVVAEEARARELRIPTPMQEYGRKVRTLTGVIQLCAWMPTVLVPLRNPIWVQFVCHKLLRLLTPYFAFFILLWAIVAASSLAGRMPLGVAAVGAIVLAALAADRRGRLRHALVEGVLIQKAIVIAGLNGVRRNWQVW